jgi:ABC-2 type transport system ATP-binding protein
MNPTSGLDPLVRREFIQTVIGAYQDAAPGRRTVFVSTHLITEFEGLIDRFTVVDQGRAVLTADADEARSRFQKIRAEFDSPPPPTIEFTGARSVRREGRTLELIVDGALEAVREQLQLLRPVRMDSEALTLEEIFLASVR